MYQIIKDEQVLQETMYPAWAKYNHKLKSFVACEEDDAEAIEVNPTGDAESFIASIDGRPCSVSGLEAVKVVKL